MATGKHYWELEILVKGEDIYWLWGVCRPGVAADGGGQVASEFHSSADS
jgi:hypothetical protein